MDYIIYKHAMTTLPYQNHTKMTMQISNKVASITQYRLHSFRCSMWWARWCHGVVVKSHHQARTDVPRRRENNVKKSVQTWTLKALSEHFQYLCDLNYSGIHSDISKSII